jgi:hypothetical protein
VAHSKIIINANNHGRFQQYAGSPSTTVTATTGTVVFKFKQQTSGTARSTLVRLSVAHDSASSTATNFPAAVYMFRLFNTSAGVCSIAGEASSMEYQYIRATHFAFADLGSGECTITLTNPTAVELLNTYYAVMMLTGGLWFLDTVTTT